MTEDPFQTTNPNNNENPQLDETSNIHQTQFDATQPLPLPLPIELQMPLPTSINDQLPLPIELQMPLPTLTNDHPPMPLQPQLTIETPLLPQPPYQPIPTPTIETHATLHTTAKPRPVINPQQKKKPSNHPPVIDPLAPKLQKIEQDVQRIERITPLQEPPTGIRETYNLLETTKDKIVCFYRQRNGVFQIEFPFGKTASEILAQFELKSGSILEAVPVPGAPHFNEKQSNLTQKVYSHTSSEIPPAGLYRVQRLAVKLQSHYDFLNSYIRNRSYQPPTSNFNSSFFEMIRKPFSEHSAQN